nr:MAG: hypothetical protein [Molluscum contagiosum virus]
MRSGLYISRAGLLQPVRARTKARISRTPSPRTLCSRQSQFTRTWTCPCLRARTRLRIPPCL